MITIIPAIDLLDGQVVRLKQGVYKDVSHFSYNPIDLAQEFEKQGASRIHIVDLNGAKDGKLINEDIIKSIRNNVSCELEIGGGIRTIENAKYLINLGINYLILGSLLIDDFELSKKIINLHPNKIIAGIDAKSENIATHGWEMDSEIKVSTLINKVNHLPLNSIIYTDIAKDGMMQGPNIPAIKNIIKLSNHKVIASGGVSSIDDVVQLKNLKNLYGCIIGKAILGNYLTLKEFLNYA